jgi:transcriptional regulator with XRE-family HTH domain
VARGVLDVELAGYRRAAGYTQAQFAQLTEYSRSTIANVETGRQHVSRDFWEPAGRVLVNGARILTPWRRPKIDPLHVS